MPDRPSRPDQTDRSDGCSSVRDELLPAVYDDLRRLAQQHLARERLGHTLQATAIVHEAFLRLAEQNDATIENRAHFCALASLAIRRVLVDHARSSNRRKRGGGWKRITLDGGVEWTSSRSIDLLALHEALEELQGLHERQARIVELRFFGGLTLDEIAQLLSVSPRTVDADWQMARAWLRCKLEDENNA